MGTGTMLRWSVVMVLFMTWGRTTALEFYYTVMRDIEQCFEEHLGEQTLVTGEIYFDKHGPITLTVRNPRDHVILGKVRLLREGVEVRIAEIKQVLLYDTVRWPIFAVC
jgi:hypothetical protein